MGKKLDLTNQAFGKWTVVTEDESRGNSGEVKWYCRCECGNYGLVSATALKSKHSQSCGCYKAEVASRFHTKHGATVNGVRSGEFTAWDSMKQRCYNPNYERFHRYGGRGIRVCDRWLNSFENFLSDMGLKPSTDHSLDKIDNDKDYGPDNCQWGTEEQQKRNMSTNIWMEHKGERKVIADWVKCLGIKNRLFRYQASLGKSFQEIIDFFDKKNKDAASNQ